MKSTNVVWTLFWNTPQSKSRTRPRTFRKFWRNYLSRRWTTGRSFARREVLFCVLCFHLFDCLTSFRCWKNNKLNFEKDFQKTIFQQAVFLAIGTSWWFFIGVRQVNESSILFKLFFLFSQQIFLWFSSFQVCKYANWQKIDSNKIEKFQTSRPWQARRPDKYPSPRIGNWLGRFAENWE